LPERGSEGQLSVTPFFVTRAFLFLTCISFFYSFLPGSSLVAPWPWYFFGKYILEGTTLTLSFLLCFQLCVSVVPMQLPFDLFNLLPSLQPVNLILRISRSQKSAERVCQTCCAMEGHLVASLVHSILSINKLLMFCICLS
jgi:hypothetical protein